MTRLHRGVAWPAPLVLIAIGALVSCGPQGPGETPGDNVAQRSEEGGLDLDGPPPEGLRFTLSHGELDDPSGDPTPPVASAPEPLDPARAQTLLAALGKLPDAEPDDVLEFAVRGETLPPPRTGRRIDASFPPPDELTDPAAPTDTGGGTLEVVRFQPEGEVPIAPRVSVTFSQPMVDVTSHREASETVPVHLTPKVEGTWRWVGTRTIVFDPKGERFPMASTFDVTIRAGTESKLGGELADDVQFSFSTPPVTVEHTAPYVSTPLARQPVLVMRFNQRVDAEAIFEHIELKGSIQRYELERVDREAVENDRFTAWIAVRPTAPLPKGKSVGFQLASGAPSAEGPRTSSVEQNFAYQVHDELELVEARCGWQDECLPQHSFELRFSNPLDTDAFDPGEITVEPKIPHVQINASADRISIYGTKRGRTTYTVTVPASLRDSFGQTLGEPETVEFEVGDPQPRISGPGGDVVVLDPYASPPSYTVSSIGYDELLVRVFDVEPDDWKDYLEFRQQYLYDGIRAAFTATPPGEEVLSYETKVERSDDDEPGAFVDTRIDLTEALGGASENEDDPYGHVMVVVDPIAAPNPNQWMRPAVVMWVQRTDIALTAMTDPTGTQVWASSARDGTPLEGVDVSVPGAGVSAATDAKGLATLPHPSDDEARMLVATRDDDVALVPWYDQYRKNAGPALLWYTFDDRHMYKPGETVRVKGWVRRRNAVHTKVERLGGEEGTELEWSAKDQQGNLVAEGTTTLDRLDGFSLEFAIPDNTTLGWGYLNLRLPDKEEMYGHASTHSFQIQEFRRPEYEVSTELQDAGPHLADGELQVDLQASYYTGGALAEAPVRWTVNTSPGHFSPPGHERFSFSTWNWTSFSRMSMSNRQYGWEELTGTTNDRGRHALHIDFDGVDPPRPTSVTINGSVEDVDRQVWSSTETLIVHPARYYIGLRAAKWYVGMDEPLDIETIVSDLDGELIADQSVRLEAHFLVWKEVDGRWQEVPDGEPPLTCELTTGEGEPETCTFSFPQGGTWMVRAHSEDPDGRAMQTDLRVWVAGGERPPSRRIERETVTLVPERTEVEPGERVKMLVQSPFSPAEGLLTVRRAGIVETRRIRLESGAETISLDVGDGWQGGVQVSLEIVGKAPRLDAEGNPTDALPPRPAFGGGTASLTVSTEAKTLDVKVMPDDEEVVPGGDTRVTLEVTDADGNPVADADVAVVVVDEAVLALSDYEIPDPVKAFFTTWPWVQRFSLLDRIALEDPVVLARNLRGAGGGDFDKDASVLGDSVDLVAEDEESEAYGRATGVVAQSSTASPGFAANMDGRAMRKSKREATVSLETKAVAGKLGPSGGQAQTGAAGPQVALRRNFDALAVFAPSVQTDADGRAVVDVTLPDNLTRYRVMAVAAAGEDRFGTGESTIQARRRLMVRPSAPRFLHSGDQPEVPVVLHNEGDAALAVDVALRTHGAVVTTEQTPDGYSVEVPAGQRVEVRFPVSAAHAGSGRVQVVAATRDDALSDAAEVVLPVWTPATLEAFAVYAELDDEAVLRQSVAVPDDAAVQVGGLEVTTSSTALHALTDAMLYLVRYRFACSEQIASRVLAVASLRDVLAAFESSEMPDKETLEDTMRTDLRTLLGRQSWDGGFPWWRHGQTSSPYLSVHVTHALVRAKAAGFSIEQYQLDRARNFLEQIESHIPSWVSERARYAIIAYALYVRSMMGADGKVPGEVYTRAREIVESAGDDVPSLDDLSVETSGWLLAVLAGDMKANEDVIETLRRHLDNRVREDAGTAQFAGGYADQVDAVLIHGSRRTDAVVLDALLRVDPKGDLAAKVVRGLLGHRTKGRWSTTQENAFVLVALGEYFDAVESETPDFVARMWLGEDYAGEHAYSGRTTERQVMDIPMAALAARATATDDDANEVLLQKDGEPGRMYARIGMRYAPKTLELAPADHGFAVSRIYEGVDDEGDVTRDDNGVWHIEAGARVRVRITLVSPDRRSHVALVDPLPAGLEALNPALAVTESVPRDPNVKPSGHWWWGAWYQHQNLRDERAEAFATMLWPGTWEYTWVARATVPGRYVAPPPRAEEMYHPETFGRGGSDIVVVEAAE